MVQQNQEQPRKNMSCGLDFISVPDLHNGLITATNSGFHYIVVPFIHPRYRRELIAGKAKDRVAPITRSDLVLTSQDWNRLIVGKFSDYLEVDCEIEHVRKQSEKLFLQELEFASHLSLPAVLLRLFSGNNTNLARILYSKVSNGCSYQVWVHMPMCPKSQNEIEEDSWEWWNKFRSLCDYDKKIGLALEVGAVLPTEQQIQRWLGECFHNFDVCITGVGTRDA